MSGKRVIRPSERRSFDGKPTSRDQLLHTRYLSAQPEKDSENVVPSSPRSASFFEFRTERQSSVILASGRRGRRGVCAGARGCELAQRLGFDPADTFTGEGERLAHFLRVLAAVLQPEAHLDDLFLTQGEGLQ